MKALFSLQARYANRFGVKSRRFVYDPFHEDLVASFLELSSSSTLNEIALQKIASLGFEKTLWEVSLRAEDYSLARHGIQAGAYY